MKKLLLLLCSFALLGSMVGCQSLRIFDKDSFMNITKGMDQQEVLKSYGQPNYRSFDEESEVWEYRKNVSTFNGDMVVTRLTFVDNRLTEMDSFRDSYNPYQGYSANPSVIVPIENPKPQINPRPSFGMLRPMNAQSFGQFLRTFKDTTFDSERYKLLETSLLTTGFTSDQCDKLLDLYTFDSERTKLMKVIYPNITDKQRFFTVIDRLTFQNSKDEMNQFIKRYHQ